LFFGSLLSAGTAKPVETIWAGAKLKMKLGRRGVTGPVHHLHFEGGQLFVVVVN
jgi:hypothetical protein